ncbi:MAG: hypothetical protein CEE40_08465 [Chloroflexi bacterium B3_Chlor]|nr:MAG: hypothetical protein CEE40_08465 [Chloroflexi bacterium B3_Chlor]
MSDKRSHQSRSRSALGLLWRTLVVGLGYTVAVMIGGMITQALGVPMPSMAADVDQSQMLVLLSLSGLLFGLTMGPLSARLTVPGLQRAVLLFVVLFILNSLINVIEALFFTTAPPAELLAGLLTSAVGHAGLALLLAALFQPASVKGGLVSALRETLAQRRWVSWIGRFALAGVLYVPIYLFFGAIISPIVLPYYQQLEMGLTVPGFDVILPLELFRGLLYALTLFLLIAALRGSRRSTAFWVVLTLCVLGSWQPMLQAAWWPIPLRVTHGLEITVDSIVQGLAITLLLWTPTEDV